MPMILYTFLDEYDFSGKTIAPPLSPLAAAVFSGRSGTIESMEPEATVTEGPLSLGSSQACGTCRCRDGIGWRQTDYQTKSLQKETFIMENGKKFPKIALGTLVLRTGCGTVSMTKRTKFLERRHTSSEKRIGGMML